MPTVVAAHISGRVIRRERSHHDIPESLPRVGVLTYDQVEASLNSAAGLLFHNVPADLCGITEPMPRVVTRIGRAKPPAWYAPTLTALHGLAVLGNDWNGYGAEPVHAASVTAALAFLSAAALPDTRPPTVVPLPSGGVQLEWRTQEIEIDVALTPDGEYDACYSGPEGELEWQGDAYSGGVPFSLGQRIAEIDAPASARA